MIFNKNMERTFSNIANKTSCEAYNEATLVNGKSMCDGQGNVNDVYNLYNNKTVCQ